MQGKIDEYVNACNDGEWREIVTKKGEIKKVWKRKPITIPGLALHLGFASRQSFSEYGKDHPGFADVISRARLRIEKDNLEGGIQGDYEPKITGLNLASNYGYAIKSELTATISGDIGGKLAEALAKSQEAKTHD